MYKNVIQNKNLMFYLIGGAVSRLGDVITGLAFLFLAYDLTGSGLHTTGIVIAETIPYLLFGLIGGVVADWVNKKKMLIIIDLLRMPLVFSVVVLYYIEFLSYGYLLVISFLIQSFGSFFNPAHRALLPMITNIDERQTANSLYDSIKRGITVLSPVISVVFLETIGVIHFFTFDAMTYLISALILSKIQVVDRIRKAAKKNLKDVVISLKEFTIWLKGEGTIRNLFFMTFIMVFFNTWVWEVGLLLSLEQISHDSKVVYSWVQGWFGFVVIAANLCIPLIWKRMSLTTYIAGSLIWGVGIIFLGFSNSVPMYFTAVLIVGLGLPVAGLSRVFLIQQYVPEDRMGRGFSFNAVLLYLSNLLSLGLFGLLSKYISLNHIFIGCGSLMLIFSIWLGLRKISSKSRGRYSV